MAGCWDYTSYALNSAVDAVLEYDTPKIVHIKSKKVGLLNRFIQLAILGYVIGYAIIWEKGYQETDTAVAAVSTKLKGVGFTNTTGASNNYTHDRVWDVADYVIPPQENGAFFVLTNIIVTQQQHQAECPEDPSIADGHCETDADCPFGERVENGNGIKLGICTSTERDPNQKVCLIRAWCPTEKDNDFPIKNAPILPEAANFTVLIKNQIEFSKFGVKRRNIAEDQDPEYLQNCRYDSTDPQDKLCPIFRLGHIVENEANENFSEMAITGGFISINIDWNCNLDKSVEECTPTYQIRRLDNRNSQIAKGWNFRYANFYYEDGVEYRDLFKAYGIRFVITVTGEAGKFSFVPLILSLGSGLALLAVSTVLCDIIAIYILKKGKYYKEKKYLYVVDDDAVVEAPNSSETNTDSVHVELDGKIGHSNPSYQADLPSTNSANGVSRRTSPNSYDRLEEDDE